MHFRSAGPRRNRRLLVPSILAAALPLLAGASSFFPSQAPSEGLVANPGVLAASDTSPYWLFFTEDAWKEPGGPDNLEAVPGRIRTRSRWLRAVSVEVSNGEAQGLWRVQGVSRVLPVRRMAPGSLPGFPSGRVPSRVNDSPHPVLPADSVYGDLGPTLDLLEVPAAHDLGFSGTGTRIGILDGLFRTDHHSIRSNPALGARDFVDQDFSVDPRMEDPDGAGSHGVGLWSLISGDWPGVLTGAAPGASVLLARVRDEADSMGVDEDRWVAGLEWLETQGARIVLSGFGFRNFDGGAYTAQDLNGDVAPATLAADEAARRGILVVAPVGNGGPGPLTLQSPSDGDSVMAVGAVNVLGAEVSFSAQGPTADGRDKPDLFAPGEAIPAATATGQEGLAPIQGTEVAGALLAGAAALFIEAYPERGPLGVLQALVMSAGSRSGAFEQVPRVAPAIVFPDGVWPFAPEEVNGQGQVTNLAPQFQWNVPTTHPLGLPVSYRLEFSEDPSFGTILLADSVVGTFARRLGEPLPPRKSLFWRVDARSTQGIGWATPPQGPLEVPSWVSLEVLNDPSGTQVAEPQPKFRWTSIPVTGPAGPLTFELQILLDREEEVLQTIPDLEEEEYRISEPLPFNLPLRWRVIAQARAGVADTVTSAGPFVVTGGENPPVTILYQNFPNPFPNPDHGGRDTRIWFDLAHESVVQLAVYDMRGRLVRSLIPGRGCGVVELPPGLYGREESPSADPCTAYRWDGTSEVGHRAAPGVYLLRLQAGGVVEVRRVVFWP